MRYLYPFYDLIPDELLFMDFPTGEKSKAIKQLIFDEYQISNQDEFNKMVDGLCWDRYYGTGGLKRELINFEKNRLHTLFLIKQAIRDIRKGEREANKITITMNKGDSIKINDPEIIEGILHHLQGYPKGKFTKEKKNKAGNPHEHNQLFDETYFFASTFDQCKDFIKNDNTDLTKSDLLIFTGFVLSLTGAIKDIFTYSDESKESFKLSIMNVLPEYKEYLRTTLTKKNQSKKL